MYVILIFFLIAFFIGIFLLNEYHSNSLNFPKIGSILVFLILVLIMGFRYDVGIDYKTYESWFYNVYNGNEYEWAFNFINSFVYETTHEFVYLTLLMAFITNIFIFLGFRAWGLKNYYLYLAIIIYISSSYFFFANVMRQGVAVAIFFYASSFILNRNWKSYFLLIFFAMSFHISACILFPLYFFKRKAIKLPLYICLILVCYFLTYTKIAQQIFNFFISISPLAGIYTGHEFIFQSEVNIFSLNVAGKVLLSLLIIFFANQSIMREKNNVVFYYQIGIMIYILSLSTFMFGRVSIFFQIFEIVAIPFIIANISNGKIRTILYLIVLCFMFTWTGYILFITAEESNLIYRTIFEK